MRAESPPAEVFSGECREPLLAMSVIHVLELVLAPSVLVGVSGAAAVAASEALLVLLVLFAEVASSTPRVSAETAGNLGASKGSGLP